jgi:hypothetical protein
MKRTLHFASLMDRQPACQSVRLVFLTCCHTFGFVRPCAAVQPGPVFCSLSLTSYLPIQTKPLPETRIGVASR